MKYFFPALMGLLIFMGVALTATPYIAEWLMPAASTSFRKANPEDARTALADWFGANPQELADAEAIRQQTVHGSTAWFAFTAPGDAVGRFVVRSRLNQQDLTPEIMQQVFLAQTPPVDWWQPASLQRRSWFSGKSEGQELALVYNAEMQRGFLLVRTANKASGGF